MKVILNSNQWNQVRTLFLPVTHHSKVFLMRIDGISNIFESKYEINRSFSLAPEMSGYY